MFTGACNLTYFIPIYGIKCDKSNGLASVDSQHAPICAVG